MEDEQYKKQIFNRVSKQISCIHDDFLEDILDLSIEIGQHENIQKVAGYTSNINDIKKIIKIIELNIESPDKVLEWQNQVKKVFDLINLEINKLEDSNKKPGVLNKKNLIEISQMLHYLKQITKNKSLLQSLDIKQETASLFDKLA